MTLLTYKVSESCLSASGASYFVKYTAEVETTGDADEVHVEMVSLHPQSETDSSLVQAAVECVREAVVEVLSAHGIGAVFRLHDFVLHPVDFNPHRCKRYTKQYLAEALNQSS